MGVNRCGIKCDERRTESGLCPDWLPTDQNSQVRRSNGLSNRSLPHVVLEPIGDPIVPIDSVVGCLMYIVGVDDELVCSLEV
jgi:hypothetical protein